jgi:outer membrane protein assembly complex protein YaeT
VIDEGVTVDSLLLRQGAGVLRGSGRYAWNTRTYNVNLDGQGLTWRGPLGGVGDAEARFSLKFSGAGSIDRPVGEGMIDFDLAGGLAGDLIKRGVANIRLNGETALITAQIPSLGAFITANVIPRQPFTYDAVVVMNRVDLSPLVSLAGLQPGHVTGFASLSATAKGALSTPNDVQAFINLQDIQADVSGVAVRLASPSRLAWDGKGLTVDVLDVTVGQQGRLLARGRLGEGGISSARWESTFKGELGDLLKIGRPFGVPAELEGSGPVTIAWQSTGGLDRSTATIQLAGGAVAWGTLPAIRDLVVDAAFDGKTLEVTKLTGLWQDGGIEGTASIPRAVLEARETGGPLLPAAQAGFAKLRVVGLSEGALAPWLGASGLAGIDGRVSATLDARITQASLEGVSGTLTLDEADFLLAGVRVAQVRPAILDIQGGLLTMKDVAFNAGGSPLTLTGTARVSPADKQMLDLELTGVADLTILSAFAPTVATDGEAKINIGIGGPLASPVLNGRIDVADAEVAIREPRVVISELNGTIAFDGRRVLFDSLTGSANGGALTLDGGFLLEGFTPTSGGLTMQVQGAALEYPEGLQSEADALVTLRPAPTGWTLIGDISVERSVYNETISLAALIAARRGRAPAAAGEESWGEKLRLNLDVSTQQDLRIDNNYGRLEAGAALRVRGTVADPSLDGRITLREGGEVYLAGNTFHISRGSISFTNPNRIVPEFDIELQTRISGADISLTLDGPLERLQTEVRSSDPEVDSREAMTMLFGGFRGEDALTLLSAELLGTTGRAIGLDSLRLQRGIETDEFRSDPGLIFNETDPSTRLTIAKRLRADVELILSQSLRESGGLTAVVSYRPKRNVELRAVSRDNQDRAVAVRHEITFGGSNRTAGSAEDVQPEVEEITFTGNPGRPPGELLEMLKLERGDRFDFHQWQQDIDRLREDYQDRNYYEVNVRGLRDVSVDGSTVDLDYRIEPGPIAELVLEGHPLEASLVEEIREAWMRTIFDRFLLEDIRTRITRHLMEEDVIDSKVDAVVAVSTPERKQVRVTVTAGTTVSKRRIQYSGAAAFDSDRLDAVVAEAGLDVDGWLDPSRLAEAIRDFYRSEGYLAAAVKADQPMIRAGEGVLPVAIEEGARFLIGAVTFPGVSPARLSDVIGAANLEVGAPFVSGDLDAAQDRVEDLYAREGFNTLQVEVDSVPNLDGNTVSVTFAILEGLQQILRDVTTDGATRTRAGVIRSALRLRVGQPVNLEDWSKARKRLYDTNVFRQVDLDPVPMEPTTADSAAGIQPVRAVVRVVEYPVWRFRYGAQFNSETAEVADPDGDTRLQSLGILADLRNQNVFGRAITAGLAARYERNRQAGSLFTSNGSFFGLPIRSSGFVFTSRQRFFVTDEFSTVDQRLGVSAEQRWRPFRLSEVIWSYRFERSHVFDPAPSPQDFFPLDVVFNISRLNAAVVFDRRDDPSDPTRGWFTAGNWEQAVRLLGSDSSAGKMLLQQSVYRGLGRTMVVAGRAQLGTVLGSEALIPSERFLLGGATTIRGYGENALGPRDAEFGLPGGDALLAVNGELRFPVRGWVQGVAFLDAGNVYATRGELSFRDLAVGYGIGLRLASPFAMLRVDFGIPARELTADRPANQFKSGRWYFGIGHIF